jgi:hypothetical protein
MSAKDAIHDAVKNALVKDGWRITADPYTLKFEDETLYADLAAEKLLRAERNTERIIVEIKTFAGRSAMHDFQMTVGQYMVYESFIAETAPEYRLFVAISDTTYSAFFQRKAIRFLIEQKEVPLIVVNLELEEIVQWIN